MHYVPLFSSIVTSSLWSEPDHVVKIFLTMLAMKDRHNVVSLSAFALSQLSHKSEAEVLDAWKILSSPDTKRLEPQKHEGRRIARTEDGSGWLILNGEYYQEMMRKANRNEYQKEKQREYRAKKNWPTTKDGQPLTIKEFIKKSVDNDPITKQDKSVMRKKWGKKDEVEEPDTAIDYESPVDLQA